MRAKMIWWFLRLLRLRGFPLELRVGARPFYLQVGTTLRQGPHHGDDSGGLRRVFALLDVVPLQDRLSYSLTPR